MKFGLGGVEGINNLSIQVLYYTYGYHNRLLSRSITDATRMADRKGILISTAGDKKFDMFGGLIRTARSLFATLNVVYDKENSLFFGGIENKQEILDHPDYLQKGYNAGQRLAM